MRLQHCAALITQATAALHARVNMTRVHTRKVCGQHNRTRVWYGLYTRRHARNANAQAHRNAPHDDYKRAGCQRHC